MRSNGFRRERNSQNEGIQEHVPVGLQKLMRTFDPRSLNVLTVPDAYPMQNMMELNFLVGKKKFITVLDMLKGYWSIPMEDSSKNLTAFRTHRGQYQWNELPFGLRNASATYQRAMSKVVQTISDFACAYINDLAIFSDTWEEHLNHLEEVFKRLEHFNFSTVYSELFAKIALPLTEFTKKNVPNEIPWSKEAENAFKRLKTALCGITELQVPDIEKLNYLHTDAFQTAVGCCPGESTVRAIKKNEAAIRKSVISGTKLSTKFASYTRDVLLERTERAIAIWIEEQVQRRIPVSVYLIPEKALQFYKSMKQSEPSTSTSQAGKEFSASKGWLSGFLKRNALHNIKITGESATADEGAAKIFPEELAKIIEDGNYSADQVFNADETGLLEKNA
ncbi:retrovirus-related Pol polyprotein from transposon 297 [Trichonephila clavipes]|nr:retrovirus-related Pol polyprotein from transposon 297 [Trichonephila clavipes]